MINQDLILKYKQIKERSIQNFDDVLQLSNQISVLVRLVHEFCQKDFIALSVSSDILEIIDAGRIKLDSVIEFSGNYLVIKHNNDNKKVILKHVTELVNIFDDGNLSEDERIFLELYFSEPDFFIVLNLGLEN